MRIAFNQTTNLIDNEDTIPILSLEESRESPWLEYSDWDNNYYYTIDMIDFDDELVHYLAINVKNGIVKPENIIISYIAPSPRRLHLYAVELYKQPDLIKSVTKQIKSNTDLTNFISQNKLQLIDGVRFYISALSQVERKFCACTYEVASKQPEACSLPGMAYRKIKGRTCTNPYAICTKSVGETSKHCSRLDPRELTDQQLIGWARLKELPISYPFDRNEIINEYRRKQD